MITETQNVDLDERYQSRYYGRTPLQAAEVCGRDTAKLIELALEQAGDEYLDMVRLDARCAFRHARCVLGERS